MLECLYISLLDLARSGVPLIIDSHTHIFPKWLQNQKSKYIERDSTFAELYGSPNAKMATVEDLIASMDEDGIDLSVAMGIGWSDPGLAKDMNDYIIESKSRYPNRIAGCAGINPSWGKKAIEETDRCARNGLFGIGELHPYSQKFDLADKITMAPLVEISQEYNLVIVTHSSEPIGHSYSGKGNTYPEIISGFIQNFPEINLVCAHWGGGLPFYNLMPEVAESLANVHFDSAASPLLYNPQIFDIVASLLGPERILMGSDYPLLRSHELISQIQRSSLSTIDKKAIMGGNASKLLGIDD